MDASNKLWWKAYRQRQSKPRETMSMEMMIRSSFVQILNEYIQNCSISGVSIMFDRHAGWKERTLRKIIFVVMFSMVCYSLYSTWAGILMRPFIVNSESSTYPIAEIDFPAVAFCNVNRISKKALKEIALELFCIIIVLSYNLLWYPRLAFRNESLEEVEQYCLQGGRLLDFTYDENWRSHAFLDVVATDNFPSKGIINAMKRLAPSCSDMLLRCAWAGEIVDCNTLFSVRRTARGHCCAFNYVLDYDSASSPNKTIAEVKRQEFPGFLYGLNVVLDPMLDDYAYPINNFRGFDVLLFDPTHFADLSAGRMSHRIAEPDYAEFLELKSTKQVASSEVRKYPIRIRKCLFKDESPDEFNSMYSYSACIVRCRIKSVQSLCKCTPYFLPTGDRGRTCTIPDLMCLNKYKEKLLYIYPIDAEKTAGLETEMEDSIFCPSCLPDCELTQHFTKSYKASMVNLRQSAYYSDWFLSNINMTNKCFVSIHHPDTDGVLDRLDVVSYWYEVLSNIGGFAGVLIGISVVSAVEIVYFFIVRFVIVFRYNYVKYH